MLWSGRKSESAGERFLDMLVHPVQSEFKLRFAEDDAQPATVSVRGEVYILARLTAAVFGWGDRRTT